MAFDRVVAGLVGLGIPEFAASPLGLTPSNIETPLSGSSIATGAVAAFSAAAIISPMRVFSSTFVRSNVTLGFHCNRSKGDRSMAYR